MLEMIDRHEDEAVAWAEQLMGGKVVYRERQSRWRPHIFLKIDSGQQEPVKVILRGFRNPGYMLMTADAEKGRLMHEADILNALQSIPIKSPKYYGKNEQLGWFLMEWVEGETQLTEIEDQDRRFEIYTTYIEQLAILHAHPLDQVDLPSHIHRPASCKAFLNERLDQQYHSYNTSGLLYPEPIFQLAFQWAFNNELPSERPLCLGLVDVGPNQFLFTDNEITSLMDVELGMVCDPLMEMGMMRNRDVAYHIGRMTEHLRHYGDCYEQQTGIPLDLRALQYWSVAGPLVWNVPTITGTHKPNATVVDMVFSFAYEVQQKRILVEALADYHGIYLCRPQLPEPQELTSMSMLHNLIIKQFEDYYIPKTTEKDELFFAENSLAITKTLALGNAYCLSMESENHEELAQLLGHKPRDWKSGLAELEDAIKKDYQKDLDKRLNFLYRFEVRRDHLFKPMQEATDLTPGWPMSRFDS